MPTRTRPANSAFAALWPALFAVALVASSESNAQSAQDARPATKPAASQPATQPENTPQEEEPAEKDRFFAITGATVHTVTGPVLHGPTVLCRNGKIIAIGPRVPIPDEAEVLDGSGLHLYPGLIAVRSSGLVGEGRPEDTTDVFGLNLVVGLAGGITTAVVGDTSAKLTYGTLDDIVIKRDLFETIRYSSRDPNSKRRLRQSFDRLQQHLRDVAAYELEKQRNPDAKKPDDSWIRGEYARHLKLLKGETKALIDAETAHELIEACELARRYGIRIVVRGAREGWTVPTELALAGAEAIVTPRASVLPNERLNRPNGSSIQNAAILREHGVRVAVTPVGGLFGPGYIISFGGLAGRDLLHLPMEAAFAVRGGLSGDEALKTITIDAARVLGIDDRVGSIEVGKDADFILCDGDLLHYMTHVRWTVVNGRIAYDKQQETLFSHIRPGGDRHAPPPDDVWPRRLGEDW